MKRVAFLIDGFNLYHSLRELERLTKSSVKWLDLTRLCQAYLQAVRSAVGEHVELASTTYFSALATHLVPNNPDVVTRHQTYLAALESTGVQVVLSRFKEKTVTCPICGGKYKRHEEKETDVALGLQLIELLTRGACDTAVLVTGDTDFVPAIRNASGQPGWCGLPVHATQRGTARRRGLLLQHRSAGCSACGRVLTKPPTW